MLLGAYIGPFAGLKDLMVNLGASFLGVIVTVLAIEPIIRRSRQPEEVIHDGFPYELFLNGVERSAYKVRILGAWPYVMDQPFRRRFLNAVTKAARRKVLIEILILDPASKAAEQRAEDLGGKFDVVGVIGDTVRAFDKLVKGLPAADAAYVDVRVYASLPPARMYRWDGRAISSFFPMGNALGTDVKHYETSAASRLAQFVDEQFELVLNDDMTRTLDEYLRLTLRVTDDGTSLAAFSVNYVVLEGEVYVETQQLTEYVVAAGLRHPTVEISSPIRHPGAPAATAYKLMPVEGPESVGKAIATAFDKKYGPDNQLSQNHSLVYALSPLVRS